MSQNTTDIVNRIHDRHDGLVVTAEYDMAMLAREAADEITRLRGDIGNATKEARLYATQYPFSEGTASEAVWACGTSYVGVSKANEDLHKELSRLRNDKRLLLAEVRTVRSPENGFRTRRQAIREIRAVREAVNASPTAMKDEPEGGGA